MDHLWEEHCRETIVRESQTTSSLKSAITSPDKLWMHQKRATSLLILRELWTHCFRIRRQQQLITKSVSKDSKFDDSLYRLPKAVTNTISKMIHLILFATFGMEKVIEVAGKGRLAKQPEVFFESFQPGRLQYLSHSVESSLRQLQNQLILMAANENLANGTSFKAIGPETVALFLMSSMHSRLHASQSTELRDIFSKYLLKLVSVIHNSDMIQSHAERRERLPRNTRSINTHGNVYCRTSIV